VKLFQIELARVVDQGGDVQCDVRAAAAEADQAHRGKLLNAARLAFVQRLAQREHHVAQAIEVIEDALDIAFGEIQILLAANAVPRQRGRRQQVVGDIGQGGFLCGGYGVFFSFHQ